MQPMSIESEVECDRKRSSNLDYRLKNHVLVILDSRVTNSLWLKVSAVTTFEAITKNSQKYFEKIVDKKKCTRYIE